MIWLVSPMMGAVFLVAAGIYMLCAVIYINSIAL